MKLTDKKHNIMEKTTYTHNIINNIFKMNDSDKIMYIIEKVFNATSPETAVTMEQVIEKGIKMGVAEDYPRGKEDGHPWYPHTSIMMGVGSPDAVMAWEEIHLHRKKMHKNNHRSVFFYWVDKTKVHQVVRKSSKAEGSKQVADSTYTSLPSVKVTLTMAEKIAKMNANPGMFRLVGDKLISESWIRNNPEKFLSLYGNN